VRPDHKVRPDLQDRREPRAHPVSPGPLDRLVRKGLQVQLVRKGLQVQLVRKGLQVQPVLKARRDRQVSPV
jgi:hypothetical protein